jgi:hypothetical protein
MSWVLTLPLPTARSKLCCKLPFSAFTMPLYLVFRTWQMESQEFGPWVQNFGFTKNKEVSAFFMTSPQLKGHSNRSLRMVHQPIDHDGVRTPRTVLTPSPQWGGPSEFFDVDENLNFMVVNSPPSWRVLGRSDLRTTYSPFCTSLDLGTCKTHPNQIHKGITNSICQVS